MEVVQADDKSVYRAVTGEPSGWNGHAFLYDPDGNGWVLQPNPGN
jgi:hypothetical protein